MYVLECVVFPLTDDELVDLCGGGGSGVLDLLQASTACMIRYRARGSALVEIAAMVFNCLQYAS